jgi:RNA polymerase sigma factor (TIGR02999 family)
MESHAQAHLTTLLNRMFEGDRQAGDDAMQLLYPALRRIASAKLRRERRDGVLDTQALVNEALVRLFGTRTVTLRNRQHFFVLVCLTMRRILIDRGRRHEPLYTVLDEALTLVQSRDQVPVIAINDVLNRFRDLDPGAYEVFQLRVAAGMTANEAAAEMACSVPTVNRYFNRARVWLYKELKEIA